MADPQVLVRRAAITIAIVAVIVGVATPIFTTADSGVQVMVEDPGAPGGARVVIADVEPYSPADQYGARPGMVVTSLNGTDLIEMPQPIYQQPGPYVTPDPLTGEIPMPPPVYQPPAPVVRIGDADQLLAIAAPAVRALSAVSPDAVTAWSPDREGEWVTLYDDGRDSVAESAGVVVFGIGVLFLIAWWLTTGRAGTGLRELGLPLALATASPFLLDPLTNLWYPSADIVHGVLGTAALLPLAAALILRIEDSSDRSFALAAVATCATGAMVAGSFPTYLTYGSSIAERFGGLLAAGITVIPGLLAAGPALPGRRVAVAAGGEAVTGGRLLASTEMAVVGLTPAIALFAAPAGALLLIVWAVAIAAAGRFTVRPLARLASRAQLQRDLVVAATEAERARVAADIHDDALQELTLLVRRLDAAGDTEGADIARTVSDKLRAICGDLRLPILDDLGVGPALDWLVLRIERLAGGEVRLERADGTRPPPDVELAFFRIAQEALANAVKHGRPPIVVRYRSADGAASLSIDDAGAGITPDAGERAEREGHFGLLNMQQRAEAIGAILDVRRWPQGGTHVQLEWRAR